LQKLKQFLAAALKFSNIYFYFFSILNALSFPPEKIVSCCSKKVGIAFSILKKAIPEKVFGKSSVPGKGW
jgi:hypothetical protein